MEMVNKKWSSEDVGRAIGVKSQTGVIDEFVILEIPPVDINWVKITPYPISEGQLSRTEEAVSISRQQEKSTKPELLETGDWYFIGTQKYSVQ